MKLQKQPNRWSCLPTAVAMFLNIDVQDIFNYLGHDGSEIRWPSLPEPWCRRSFHPQEISHYVLERGYAMVPFAPKMGYPPEGSLATVRCMEDTRFADVISGWNGIYLGRTGEGHAHAILFAHGDYYDPTSGQVYLGTFEVDTFVAFIPTVM